MPARTFSLATWILVGLFTLAACTPANTAPTVTITSPAEGATVPEGNTFVLAADASDAQDGNLSAALQWSSDIDGALSPAANGEVRLSVGTHVLTARVADSLGLTGSNSVTVVVSESMATHAVTDGLALRLVAVVDGQLVEVAAAAIPADGLLDGHAIFNVVHHPIEPWLYTASANDCRNDIDWCWGNGRIDRFVVDGDTIAHAGAAFLYDASQTDVSCALGDAGHEGQVGICAPNGMAFSSDATRFYVDDDDYDHIHLFAADADGSLTFLAEGASTWGHGLTIDPTDTYLYNGAAVIDVTGDIPVDRVAGIRGNGTALVALPGPGLITTADTDGVSVYDLTDPAAPLEVDTYYFGANSNARDLAFVPSLERVLTLGQNVVHSLSFTAGTFALDDTYTATEAFDTEYRGVALAGDGTAALATWFRTDAGTPVGGIDLFAIAADGTLERIDRLATDGGSRVVLALP